MSKPRKYYKPTEAEDEAIGRAALVAAWSELQPLNKDEAPMREKVLACLRAFSAAHHALVEAERAVLKAHPKADDVSHGWQTIDIVCSAFMGLDYNPAEIHPRSMVSGSVVALLQAYKALEALSLMETAFEDDGVFGTHLADEAVAFAEAHARRWT